MKIHHLALYVRDLERTKAFYETYFGAVSNDQYHNPKTGLRTYFLSFGNGCKIEIMTRPNATGADNGQEQLGYTHLAFCVADADAVDALTNRLRDDGYIVCSEPRRTGDGYYESCVLDPEGNQIELVGG
ncbi:MAG: VOC family protein [Oscillospiraceae bacterium]|nr:VOC family protein [Oscillospiraceae bacterium]